MVGKSVAHYTLVEKIGEGGMGEVYRATDTRLRREVALKILPESFAADPQRMARFQREAEVLASLNHPNIAGVFGLEQEGPIHAIAMELAEGETLSARIRRGAIPLSETLHIVTQIALALEAAHEKGIIHRDLKPANVMVSEQGAVKVLDFGLAKATQPMPLSSGQQSNSPTFTLQATQAGVLLGTAAYMSPEQARGKPVDRRTDVWAFGCLLYECVTGFSPFSGETVSDTIGNILHAPPDLERLAGRIPHSVVQVIRRCLEKDPHSRLHHIADARILLQEDSPEIPSHAASEPQRSTLVWVLAATTLLLATLSGYLSFSESETPIAAPLERVSAGLPALSGFASPKISPDGSRIVFVADGRLWMRRLSVRIPDALTGTAGATSPFWSPDSRWVAYFVKNRIFKTSLDGGTPVPVASMAGDCIRPVCGGAWTDSGLILWSSGSEDENTIWSVGEGGGNPQSHLQTQGSAEHFHDVQTVPGTKALLVTVDPDNEPDRVDLWTGDEWKTVAIGARPFFSNSGHILFFRGNEQPSDTSWSPGLWAIQFSAKSMETVGEPFLVSSEAVWASAADNGTLCYLVEGEREHQLVAVDRNGAILETITPVLHSIERPSFSRDGEVIVFQSTEEGKKYVWVFEPKRGIRNRLDFPADGFAPQLLPDKRTVLFAEGGDSEEVRIVSAPLSNTLSARELAPGWYPQVSLDGQYLVYSLGGPTNSNIRIRKLNDPGATDEPFLEKRGFQGGANLSPDRRFLAYFDGPAYTDVELFLSTFPGAEERLRISTDSALLNAGIRWNRDGTRLYYVDEASRILMEVSLEAGAGLRLSSPTPLFGEDTSNVSFSRGFEISPDGTRFLVVRSTTPRGGDTGGLILVRNWASEFSGR